VRELTIVINVVTQKVSRTRYCGKAEDIQTLRDLGDGTFIQIAERLEYLVAFNQEYKGKTIAGNEGLFYRLYKPWTDMNLHGTNKNILSSFRERI